MSSEAPTPVLYQFYKSVASEMVRIAFSLKKAQYIKEDIDISVGQHKSQEYLKINPTSYIPAIKVGDQIIGEFTAILEYIEEAYNYSPHLLPPIPDFLGRARVREILSISSTSYLPEYRAVTHLKEEGDALLKLFQDTLENSFKPLETIISQSSGVYSVKDTVSIADIVLFVMVNSYMRVGCNLSPYPTIVKVFRNLSKIPEFVECAWYNQPECPESQKSAKDSGHLG
ncbi:putative maleylacetoacetate isomerase 2 [Smittium mucronatum]|uniref:Putative maleylacetoacetate isomerase 2 n=1 Tax=Smittium mucronatum TaxID=133383 RepID=A0A1R0H3W2_9FUNG|nr:putative maleylacetoacetate isomerase 2 [Smittium mucronatum]